MSTWTLPSASYFLTPFAAIFQNSLVLFVTNASFRTFAGSLAGVPEPPPLSPPHAVRRPAATSAAPPSIHPRFAFKGTSLCFVRTQDSSAVPGESRRPAVVKSAAPRNARFSGSPMIGETGRAGGWGPAGSDERSGLMKRRASITVAAVLAFGPTLVVAAEPARPAPLIQVGVDLVRFDATVTDKDGRPVTDLRPEDFRLKINGELVPVENAVFFGPAGARGGAAADAAVPAAAADVPRERAPERSIVFLIDDLNLAPEGIAWTRDALQAFAAKRPAHDAAIGVRFTSDESDKV